MEVFENKFYQRRFINEKHGRAYTIAKVVKEIKPEKSNNKYESDSGSRYWSDYVNAYLEIGDCNNSACLDFSFGFANKKTTAKQVEKMDRFIETCIKMRAAMVKDNKVLRKKFKKFQKAEKKKKK